MFAIVLFIAGAILGSFATALAYRLPRGEIWVTERSRCPACGAQIRARDNVPILSWLILRGMGMGDAKLVAMIGLFIGRAVAPATLIGFALGALVGVAMIARQGSAARKQAIPFGPFLAVGGVIGLWFGDDMVQWYLDEFFPAE